MSANCRDYFPQQAAGAKAPNIVMKERYKLFDRILTLSFRDRHSLSHRKIL